MIEFLIIFLFVVIIYLGFYKNKILNKINDIKPLNNEPQQICGMARVLDKDNKLVFIHTGCSVEPKGSYDETMPGLSPFGDDDYDWDKELR